MANAPVSLYYITKTDFEGDLMFYNSDDNSWYYTLALGEAWFDLALLLKVKRIFEGKENVRVKELRGEFFDV